MAIHDASPWLHHSAHVTNGARSFKVIDCAYLMFVGHCVGLVL